MKKKIAYLGAGTWGFTLASLLAKNNHEVTVWVRDETLALELETTRIHRNLPGAIAPDALHFTHNLHDVLSGADILIESISSLGIRPVFSKILEKRDIEIPIILTSKGIEQKTGLLLPEVISELIHNPKNPQIGCISGPSLAEEVFQNRPTAVVCSAYEPSLTTLIQKLFTTPTFRVYPNMDLKGVCFGGAMKNIIAIACGISDGLGYADNTKAALMTRGLHEMRKLSVVKDCQPETLNGLSGMGDLCVTCLSVQSRNYRYGRLIAEGFSPEGARQKIGMAIEGVYTCVSAYQLALEYGISIPITQAIYAIIYEGLHPLEAVQILLQRDVQEEHL